MKTSVIKRAKKVLRIERDAIGRLAGKLDGRFEKAVELLGKCLGRVVVTGMGKPGIIGQKISATFSSLGIPSLWLHPAEAAHGDLGRVTGQDVVVALSHSGETDEVLHLLPVLKRIGAKLIVVTGNPSSRLAGQADVTLNTHVRDEASPWGLVPTASTTAMLALGDALAIALSEKRGFSPKDFAQLHPAGSLGKRLTLRVEDLMRKGAQHAMVAGQTSLHKALLAITRARAGSCTLIDKQRHVLGIFTDGDLRRHLREGGADLLQRPVREFATLHPVTIREDRLAAEALNLLKSKRIDEVPVLDRRRRAVGLLDVQDLLKAGFV